MAKLMMFDNEGRQKILAGVEKLYKAVTSTLGPGGRNVAIARQYGAPKVTKDGVSVAKEVDLDDPWENIGASMVKEVASRTNEFAGDGTTTATLLAHAIYKEGLKNITAGANPTLVKRGIDRAVERVVSELKGMSKKISTHDEIKQVATISANGEEEIGTILADALEKVGSDGTITVDESKTGKMGLDVVEGMSFDKGYSSTSVYFINDPQKRIATLENCRILFFEKKISSLQDMLPLLQAYQRIGDEKKSLLIVCEEMEEEPLATLIVNKMQGTFNVCVVKAPYYGERRKEVLQDMAIVTGGTVITEDLGLKLENVTLQHLGFAKKVIVQRDRTMIVGGNGKKEDIEARAAIIKQSLEDAPTEFDKNTLQWRLARLTSGVAIIHVGAATDAELKEKRDRVDDAVHAAQAAIDEGIVPGGGTALIRAKEAIANGPVDALTNEDEYTGYSLLMNALTAPLMKLCENNGKSGELIVAKVSEMDGNNGYNVATGTFGDLIEMGVVDPTKVTRTALQNAAGVAGLMLTMDCLMVEKPEENKQVPPQMPPMM